MSYILTTAKRKNAKRHIVTKSDDLDYLRKFGMNNLSDTYIVAIYDSKWNMV